MTKKAQPRNKAQVQKAQPKAQAPKGRNNSAQGNALGHAPPGDQSPKGAKQPEQSIGYDELGNALPPSAIADSDLPTGWQWVRVHEVGAVQLGRQRAPKHESGANMRPYLRVANVFEDRIDLSDVKTMNFTPSEFETFKLKPNDILLNEGQSLHLVGRPALYRGEVPGACFRNTLVRFRPGPKVDPKFALTIFRGYMHTGKFQKIARWTTNIAHLGASRFAEMPLAAPELSSITDGPFGSNLKTEHYTSSGPRVIRLQNIGDGAYVDEEAHITQEHFERLKKHRVFANDVIIAGFGENPPRSCVIPESLGPAIVKADCIRFKPHTDVLSKYMNAALNSDPVRKRTKGMVHGVGRPRLNLGEIKSIVLPLPSLAEQTRIVAEVERRLSVVEELEAVVTTNLQRATCLRQAILQKTFTGELVS